MTNAIDKTACIAFIRASISTPSISKFLLVSALSIRRGKAEWFSEEGWKEAIKVNTEIMPTYYKAKLASDEVISVLGEERSKKGGFQYIVLRPGMLTDDEKKGKISLGRTDARGKVSRADVADVAARLLEVEGANGYVLFLSNLMLHRALSLCMLQSDELMCLGGLIC